VAGGAAVTAGREPVAGSSQRGVVLLSVLLVLALLSALAWQLMGKHSLVIAQSRFTFAGDQALEYALGAEAFARQILYEEWSVSGPGKDTLLEVWAQPAAPFEVDNGFLEVQVRDMHACFNLNSLAGGQQNLERLKTLLRNRDVPDALADAWRDWVDADQDINGFGAEDGEYLLEDTPYRTANAPAAHVSELRLLHGIEREYLQALENVVCVLPTTELRVNINTADAAVLAALSPSLNEAQLQAFTEAVRDYDNVSAVTAELPDLAVAVDALTVSSEYFRVDVRARVDDSQIELSTLLRRDPSSGRAELVSRDLGRNFQSLFTAESEEEE
jgi:general secretion pathway protein K